MPRGAGLAISTLLLAIGAILAAAPSHAQIRPTAKQKRPWLASMFGIRAVSPWSDVACTATLLKLQGQCVLVSDYHCVPELAGLTVRLHASYGHPMGFDASLNDYQDVSFDWVENFTLPLEIIRRDRASDLAQFKIPSEIEPRCEMLKDLTAPAPDVELKNQGSGGVYAAMGLVTEEAAAVYSSDMRWGSGSLGSSQIGVYRYGPRPFDVAYELRDLTLTPGMSGGVTISLTGDLLGLNSRLIPFQNATFVTPLARVAEFISGTLESPAFLADLPGVTAVKLPVGSNSTSGAGGNGHAGGGGNGHAGGGGNGHAGGGGNGHAGGGLTGGDLGLRQALDLAREPDEGVPFPGNPGQILLGVDGLQIDGTDDYWLRYEPRSKAKGGAKNVVTRPVDGYPELKVRQKILDRLAGFYTQGSYLGSQKSQHSVFVESPGAPLGYKLATGGGGMFYINVDPDKKRIRLYIARHELAPAGMMFGMPIASQIVDVELLPIDAEAKRLQVRLGQVTLDCDNRHYLKLVCSSPWVELSVSVDAVENGKLTYRLIQAFAKDGKRYFDYQFGVLQKGTKKNAAWIDEVFHDR